MTQEEELRVTNDELILHTEKLTASEEELRVQQEELAQANSELEAQSDQLEEKNKIMQQKNEEIEQASIAINIKADELETSSNFKSEFLANMSHELRTPLNSILILSKLLEGNKDDNLTEKQVEFAKVINNSGSDLLKLINEVLDLSKVESGKTDLNFENHKSLELIDGLQSAFFATAKDKNVEFVVNTSPDLPESIWTDDLRLSQIVKNLLSNAFKFTPEEGTVTINFDVIEPKSSFTAERLIASNEILAISVTDTGIGIEEDKLDLVFKAFKQADGSTQRQYGGTGLGLSISKELASLLGGDIELESEFGKGSTFTVYLPLETDFPEAKETPAPTKESTNKIQKVETKEEIEKQPVKKSGKKLEAVIADDRAKITDDSNSILIVEDDLSFAKIVLDVARESGFEGIVVDHGDQVEDYISEYTPNAIILDMKLPGKDGWTILKELKAGPHSNIPVHVMSGMDKKKLGMELGAEDYMMKPISIDVLNTKFSSIAQHISDATNRILIIEDDKNQNTAIKELVSANNLKATCAYSGKEALELMNSHDLDMAILDLGLPDCNGIDLLKDIKKINKEMPVIIFTGRELDTAELKKVNKYNNTSIVLKSHTSHERLVDEVELFMNHINKKEEAGDSTFEFKKLDDGEEVLDGKRVLCVDDDMRNIYALQVVLEAEGIEVLVATNGEEAVEAVTNNDGIDCVLMDIMMPVMDGYEATDKIRKMGKDKLPIIALTAKAMKGDREKCLEAGLSDYLSKPLDTTQLLSLMRVWMYGK